jgi:hypothetical protein
MKFPRSVHDIGISLIISLVVTETLVNAAAASPFLKFECETSSPDDYWPCNVLINRPRPPASQDGVSSDTAEVTCNSFSVGKNAPC